MKVLMIGRSTLFSHPGGDTMQLTKTATYLNKTQKVNVDIKTVEEEINYSDFDFIHLFNICRPADLLGVIKAAKKPYVVSTVFVDFSEAEKNHFKASRRLIYSVLGFNKMEYLKAIARIIKGHDKLTDISYIFKGQKKSIKKIIKGAKILLPNSQSEYDRLVKAYGIKQKHRVIPNAIDIKTFSKNKKEDNSFDKFNNAVVSVGQITPVKNQLNLIKALKDSKYRVFIIGSPSSNALGYYNKCKEEASSNIEFIPHLQQEDLVDVFKRAKVHALASWFETTGLVSLEAAYSGCNIVISNRGDQKEYFKEDVFYCEPTNISSITEAVHNAFNEKFNSKLKKRIETNYIWEKTAEETYKAYKSVFSE